MNVSTASLASVNASSPALAHANAILQRLVAQQKQKNGGNSDEMKKEAPDMGLDEGVLNAFPLTAIDRQILAMKDEDFHCLEWKELREIISANRLEELKRRPSDLRRYLAWSKETKEKYGSITNFVVKERLHWQQLPSESSSEEPPRFEFRNPTPFADKDDFRILKNDWPYGLAPGITHICVWLKTPIATDPETGDVTAESRALIEDFVNKTFTAGLDETLGAGDRRDRVIWFKNWVALQSVRGVDHVHVLVKDASDILLDEWTKA